MIGLFVNFEKLQLFEENAQDSLDRMYQEIREANNDNLNCEDGWYVYGLWVGRTNRDPIPPDDLGFRRAFELGLQDGQGERVAMRLP